jgi:hypothetical protein
MIAHSEEIWLTFTDVYPVDFYVIDQRGAVIGNSTVTLNGVTMKTDENGHVRFYAKKSVGSEKYEYFVSQKDGKRTGTFQVTDDTSVQVAITQNTITIEVMDDFGTRLPVNLTIANQTYELLDGRFQGKVFGDDVPYSLTYLGIVKQGHISSIGKPNVREIYDMHAPIFGQIQTDIQNNRARMVIPITDEGTYASGVDPQSLQVYYRPEKSDENTKWERVTTYTTGRNLFAAEFPEFQPNSIVQFKAEVKDNAGNKALVNGRFTTYESGVQIQNGTTQNTTNPPTNGQNQQDLQLIYTIGGVFVLVLCIYFVIRFIKSRSV